jgi:hypothetical protein
VESMSWDRWRSFLTNYWLMNHSTIGSKWDKMCGSWLTETDSGRQTIQTQLGGQFCLKIQDTEGVNLLSITYMGWGILWLLTFVILSIPGVDSWSVAYQGWIRDPWHTRGGFVLRSIPGVESFSVA